MNNTHSTWKFLLSGFGSGWLPIAPGTWGTGVAILMAWPLCYVYPPYTWIILTVFSILFFWIGVKGSDLVADQWGKDPKQTVIDEMVGTWITLLGGPLTWPHLLLGFFLFRFFDIAKPLGVRRIENIPGGFGVMLDDVMAGVYANLVIQVIFLFWKM
jgi:phosphatidylglycerophosphatase A